MNVPAQIVSDNEQDRAAAERWWRESTNDAKMDVWAAIQMPYGEGSPMEIMSRMAQLCFGELMEKYGPGGTCSCGEPITQDRCPKCGTWHDLYGRR